MSIDVKQLRKYIIEPTLKHIEAYSKDAVELLILTAAQESAMGKYIHQIGGGPAVGIYQMEPFTHADIWENYLIYNPDLAKKIQDFKISRYGDNYGQMCGNYYYSTAMARALYLRFHEPIPCHEDIAAMAAYWKEHWNTSMGAGTCKQAIANYEYFTKANSENINV